MDEETREAIRSWLRREAREKGDRIRKKPLANVLAEWEREESVYPDSVRVTMEDGHVIRYRKDPEDTVAANMETIMEILRKMPVYGGTREGRPG